MLKNVDDIISRPFPVNRVFNRKLTNFDIGFILQPFFRLQLNSKASSPLESGFEKHSKYCADPAGQD